MTRDDASRPSRLPRGSDSPAVAVRTEGMKLIVSAEPESPARLLRRVDQTTFVAAEAPFLSARATGAVSRDRRADVLADDSLVLAQLVQGGHYLVEMLSQLRQSLGKLIQARSGRRRAVHGGLLRCSLHFMHRRTQCMRLAGRVGPKKGTAREGGSGPFLQEAASKHPRLPLAAAAAGPAPRSCEIRSPGEDPWRGFTVPARAQP